MFSGLRRRVGLAAWLAASVAGLALTGTAAAASAAEAEPAADFLTVSSTAAGGFDNLAPGDTANWFVTAHSSAAVDADLTLQVRSGSTSPLLTDAAQGLRLQLTACTTAWTHSAEPGCPGTANPIAQGPLAALLGGYRLPALSPGGSAYYLARVTVPPEATNAVAGQAADLSFEITAVQGDPGGPGDSARDAQPASVIDETATPPGAGGAAMSQQFVTQTAANLADTGLSAASACRALALALLAAGSLVLVLRRVGAN